MGWGEVFTPQAFTSWLGAGASPVMSPVYHPQAHQLLWQLHPKATLALSPSHWHLRCSQERGQFPTPHGALHSLWWAGAVAISLKGDWSPRLRNHSVPLHHLPLIRCTSLRVFDHLTYRYKVTICKALIFSCKV